MMEGFRSGRMLTARLELVAALPEDIAAELDSPGALGLRLGALVEEAWPPGEYDTDARRFFLREMREAGAGAAGWFIWYALRREPAAERPVLIAAAGFLGPPGDQGDVEIGFSVMPGWRRRGYGREIVTSLVGNAFSDSRVRRVIAQTSLRNPAACRVLEESGFERWGDFGPGGRACYVALRESGRKD